MRKILLIFLLAIVFPLFLVAQIKVTAYSANEQGQSYQLVFPPEDRLIKLENDVTIVDYFKYYNESQPGMPVLPHRTVFIAIPPNTLIKPKLLVREAFKLENCIPEASPVIYLNKDSVCYDFSNSIEKRYLGDVVLDGFGVSIEKYFWYRDVYIAAIEISTHLYDWKRQSISELRVAELEIQYEKSYPFSNIGRRDDPFFERTLSSLLLNYSDATQFTFKMTTIQDSTGNWIDYSQEYIKFPVASDGIYRVYGSNLSAQGIDLSKLSHTQLKLFRDGIQVPIYVKSSMNIGFALDDYIEFYATRRYGASDYESIVNNGADYKNYNDIYSDTSYYWLAFTGAEGIRTKVENHPFGIGLDTLSGSTCKVHLEEDKRLWYYDAVTPATQLPAWQHHKIWTWLILNKGGVTNIKFNASDVVPDQQGSVIVRLISNAADVYANSHKIGAELNSSGNIQPIEFDYRETVNYSFNLPSNSLVNGENTLKLSALTTSANFYQVLVDWVDVTYQRSNKMVNDSILIIIPSNMVSGKKIIKIDNASASDYLIYKISPDNKIIKNYSLINGVIHFSDTVKPNDRYYVTATSKAKTPLLTAKKAFKNLRSGTLGADHLIIASSEYQSDAELYQQFISEKYSVRTISINVEDIFDEFGYGNRKPEAIRDFLKSTFSNWIDPNPAYVLFVGDANYDYKDLWPVVPSERKRNAVPSYGNPVSDVWYTMFNETGFDIPQLFVGRLPNVDSQGLDWYSQKFKSASNRPMDLWNKSALLFSGGNQNNVSELQQIFNTHATILDNTIVGSTLGGRGYHFYKTVNPPTNFGPYNSDYINAAFGDGGVFISYIGHSGTQTWDNGITGLDQLQNNFSDRHPLISDFGCSTGKFAEPDINSFGELFVRDAAGQAIGYIGNSSFGYLSTSLRVPQLFYETLVRDTIVGIGEAHLIAKIKNISQSGINDVNKVFTYCNHLFGDPIFNLSLPMNPDFKVIASSIKVLEDQPSEEYDSVTVQFVLVNSGRTVPDSITIKFQVENVGNTSFSQQVLFKSPAYSDTLIIRVPAKTSVGQNRLLIEVDPNNTIQEFNETNNQVSFEYNIYSSSFRDLLVDRFYSVVEDTLFVLNPGTNPNDIAEYDYTISTSANFIDYQLFSRTLDTIKSSISLTSLPEERRYWIRSRFKGRSEWGQPLSFFYKKNYAMNWLAVDEPQNITSYFKKSVSYDTINRWTLQQTSNALRLTAASIYEGEYGSLLLNQEEVLPNTFYWGIAAVELDSITLTPTSIRYFVYPRAVSEPALVSYIDSLNNGTIVAFIASSDPVEPLLGFSTGTPARKALEKMGSLYADSIKYRQSWCMIGKKGAPMGSVVESLSKHFEGPALIEKTVTVPADSGYIAFPKIGPASRWGEMAIKRQLPAGTKLITDVYGIKNDGSEALLLKHTSADTALSLTSINPTQYPFIRLQPNFYANNLKQSPTLAVAAVDFDGLPELAINYQVMSLSRDSVMQGETVDVMFDVYNVGFSVAKQFQVVLEGVDPNNARTTLATYQVDTLGKNSKKRFAHTYTAVGQQNRMTFVVTIDPQNAVSELYEDNNSFSRELKITQDTSRPSVFVTFDDIDILDGDFVSSKPTIDVVYNDPSALTAADTGLVQIFLNNTRIYHNDPSITTSFHTANPKIKVQYKPELEDGKYQLKVQYTNPSGSFTDTSGVKKIFTVESQSSLTYVYNYPNPMKDETYFTFKLTTIPKEFFIKIYTIAGRLIREISVPITDLKHDFNRIYWDAKDQDGDSIANGVYFARFIMKADDKSEIVTQKIAVVK